MTVLWLMSILDYARNDNLITSPVEAVNPCSFLRLQIRVFEQANAMTI